MSNQSKTKEELIQELKEVQFVNIALRVLYEKSISDFKKAEAALISANKEFAIQNGEKEKRIAELTIANTELALQNEEKDKRLVKLNIAIEKAQENDQLKSVFLANICHEIRTPLNCILGFTELLKDTYETNEKQHSYIEMIKKGGDQMLNLTSNLIDISKIQSGYAKVSLSACNLNNEIEFVYSFFQPEVEKKGMQIFYQNSLHGKEAIINTDLGKLNAILINLVKNAIKYSNSGTIEFGYHLNSTSNPLELMFFVKDTGIGISKDKQETIFNRFIQIDRERNRNYYGVGLGLSIVKTYVDLLCGKLWVKSEPGKGSTFYFTIPYIQVPEEIRTSYEVV